MIVVNSMSDLFHKDIPTAFVDSVFDTMEAAHWHTFQVLTKRSSLLVRYLRSRYAAAESAPPHIWLGVSVEDQGNADERIPFLLRTPAVVRFLSVEPFLGPVDLTRLDNGGGETYDALTATVTTPHGHAFRTFDTRPLDWVIVGGESGPGARPMDAAWARSIRDQCRSAGVPFFFKQMARRAPIPDDLLIRELPSGAVPDDRTEDTSPVLTEDES